MSDLAVNAGQEAQPAKSAPSAPPPEKAVKPATDEVSWERLVLEWNGDPRLRKYVNAVRIALGLTKQDAATAVVSRAEAEKALALHRDGEG